MCESRESDRVKTIQMCDVRLNVVRQIHAIHEPTQKLMLNEEGTRTDENGNVLVSQELLVEM